MPSSYTTNGGIELPANGEQSSTWGNTVNDNMEIIDRLTNGVGSITLSGTTHTLTTSNGTLSDGQYSVLVLSGSPSGTNTVTVSPDDAQHVYIVRNNSSETATFTQGSGGNVSVLTNTTKIIYCDGAGSGAAVVDITNSIDLTTLIINGATVTATAAELNVLDGITATTAELNAIAGLTATAAELNVLDGITSTTAELNILDGSTSASTVAVQGSDQVIVNDGGVMKQVTVDTLNTYVQGPVEVSSDTSPELGGNLNLNNFDITGTGDIAITGSIAPTAASGLVLGDWTIYVSGGALKFKHSGTDRLSLTSSGELIVEDDVTAFGAA